MDKDKELTLDEMLKFTEKIENWRYFKPSGGDAIPQSSYRGEFNGVYLRIEKTGPPLFFARYRTYYELSIFVNNPNEPLLEITLGYYKVKHSAKMHEGYEKVVQLYERLESNRLLEESEKNRLKIEDALKKVRGG